MQTLFGIINRLTHIYNLKAMNELRYVQISTIILFHSQKKTFPIDDAFFSQSSNRTKKHPKRFLYLIVSKKKLE